MSPKSLYNRILPTLMPIWVCVICFLWFLISLAIVFAYDNILWACRGSAYLFVCLAMQLIHHLWITQLQFHFKKIWKYNTSHCCNWHFLEVTMIGPGDHCNYRSKQCVTWPLALRDTVSFLFVDVLIVFLFIKETMCFLASPNVQWSCLCVWFLLKGLQFVLKLPIGLSLLFTLVLKIILMDISVCVSLLICIFVGLWCLLCCQFNRNGWKSVCIYPYRDTEMYCWPHTQKVWQAIIVLLVCSMQLCVCVFVCTGSHMVTPVCCLVGTYSFVYECVWWQCDQS